MKFVLPVNIFFQEPVMSAQEQLLRITQNNPSIADFWAGFSWQYEKTRTLAASPQTTTTTPLILYIIAEKIKLARSEDAPRYADIILSLASIWTEIEARLENTIADPTILYGTDLLQDIFNQAHLYTADTKARMFSDKPRYSDEMEALFAQLESFTTQIPHLYLKFKQAQSNQYNLSFNDYLVSQNITTLASLTTINADNIWSPQPQIFKQAPPFVFSLTSPSTWGNYFRSSWSAFRTPIDAPLHLNADMECTYDLMVVNGHTDLLGLVDNTIGNYWIERERLLWCYANAALINEGNDTAILLTCIGLYTFNEKASLISKAFVKEFHPKELSLLKQIKMPDNISLPNLMAALRELNQEERSDWIEGLLLLHNMETGQLGNIKNTSTLAHLKNLAFLNPSMFSAAYSGAEESYRERFLCYLARDHADVIKDKAYADEILELMNRYTQSGWKPSLFYWTQRILNLICEQPSWCYNHPMGTLFTIATSVVLIFFPVIALLELTGIVSAFTEFFGPIGGVIASHTGATFLKKLFFMPADHLIHTVDIKDLQTNLHLFEPKPAAIGSIKNLDTLRTIRYINEADATIGAPLNLQPPTSADDWKIISDPSSSNTASTGNLITPLLGNTHKKRSSQPTTATSSYSCTIM